MKTQYYTASSLDGFIADPNDSHEQKTNSSPSQTIVVDTDEGDRNVGKATEDTDGDGKADTAVVRDDDGDTWLFTDKNGDGRADVATEITRSGEVTMSEHRGDDWVEVEHGHIESDGRYVTDSKSGILDDSDEWFEEERFEGVVRIDSTTGQWISPN